MFNSTAIRFSNTKQVSNTVKHMKENKKGKLVQYPLQFKRMVVDLEIETRELVESQLKIGVVNDDFVTNNKFSLPKFLTHCGLGTSKCLGYEEGKQVRKRFGLSVSQYTKWKDHYNKTIETSPPLDCYSMSRQGAGDNFKDGARKGIENLTTDWLKVKEQQVKLSSEARAIGFKLVKVA